MGTIGSIRANPPMPAQITKQVEILSEQAGAFAASHGAKVVIQFQSECILLIEWIRYLSMSQRTSVADSLLDGASSSIREAAACLALGLVRPALFSLRMQIDLILAWLYFKDHPVEWRTVNDFAESFKLKREILDYLSDHYKGFSARFAVLKEVAARQTEDPYRLLSAHVHAQSVPALPIAINLADVVRDEAVCTECTIMAREVCEFTSDILSCVYGSKWAALPGTVRSTIEARLASGKKGTADRFFSSI